MNLRDTPIDTAAALRRAFDQSFADAPDGDRAAMEDLLAIQVGGAPHAVRLDEVAGLYADHPVVPIPSPDPQLCGIAAFRNTLAPVFDLRLLLGYPAGPRARWLVLVRGTTPLGLAFDRFDGHLRIPLGQRRSTPAGDSAAGFLRGAVQTDSVVRPVVHLTSVLEAIAQRVRSASRPKER